jgi:hypothetical protein
VLSVAGALSHVCQSLRSVAPELPEDSWPLEKIKDVERSELQLLIEAVSKCEEKGLICTELRHLALKHICLTITKTPGAISDMSEVQALEGGVTELLGFLDHMVTGLAAEGFADIHGDTETLAVLTRVLRNTVETKSWHESLDAATIIKFARTTCIATQWCVSSRHRADVESLGLGRRVAILPLKFPPQEQLNVIAGLLTVLKALSEVGPAKVLKSRPATPEATELLKDLQNRYRALEKPQEPPAILGAAPVLPAELKQPLSVVLGYSAPPVSPTPAKKKVEKVKQVESSPAKQQPDSASSGWLSSTFNALRWTFLAAVAVGALSQDGLGILNFHILPTPLKDLLWDVMRAQVAKVDMQLSRTAPPKYLDELPATECITLGPISRQEQLWGCDSTYIQPQMSGPSAPAA